MDPKTVKTGATFRPELNFSQAEWNEIYPYESAKAQLVDATGTRRDLVVTVDAVARTIILSATATGWAIGPAAFDLRVTRGGRVIPIPYSQNVQVNIIPGATQ